MGFSADLLAAQKPGCSHHGWPAICYTLLIVQHCIMQCALLFTWIFPWGMPR